MLGSQTKRHRPGTRVKNVTLYYTEDTDEETKQRALEICERYNVEAELVKLHKDYRVEDWKNVTTNVSEIARVLKEGGEP